MKTLSGVMCVIAFLASSAAVAFQPVHKAEDNSVRTDRIENSQETAVKLVKDIRIEVITMDNCKWCDKLKAELKGMDVTFINRHDTERQQWAYPTIYYLVDGQVVEKDSGFKTRKHVEDMLNKIKEQ